MRAQSSISATALPATAPSYPRATSASIASCRIEFAPSSAGFAPFAPPAVEAAPDEPGPKLALDDAYRVDEIKVEGNGKIRVTFDLCDEALTAEEFQNLVRFYNRLSKKSDVRPSEVEDIVEMTVKSVSEAAKRLRVEMTVEDNIRDEEE